MENSLEELRGKNLRALLKSNTINKFKGLVHILTARKEYKYLEMKTDVSDGPYPFSNRVDV